MITMENYEGWLMRYADGELDADGRRMVETFLDGHPELKEELEGVAAVRVTPVLATMPHKERLMKKEAAAFAWWHVAAAVALLAITGTTVIFLNRQPEEAPLVAKAKPASVAEAMESEATPVDTTPAVKPAVRKQKAAAIAAVPEIIAMPADNREELLLAEVAEPQPTAPDSAETEPSTLPHATVTVGITVTDARLAVNPWHEALMAIN